MIPRGRLDISYRDLIAGSYYCFFPNKPDQEQFLWPNSLCCLSVRSGFDLILQVLSLPSGSEVLITDINIPGMFEILKAHHLIAIPLAIDKHTLSMNSETLEANISASTRAVVFTHLFGSISDISTLAQLAKQRGLYVIEDCAQAFNGRYKGHELADAVMFSFGMIKTNTALGGGVLIIKNEREYTEVLKRQRTYQVQERKIFIKKLFIALTIQLLSIRALYSLFYKALEFIGKHPDETLSGFTRGFSGGDLLKKIRTQPCRPLILMIQRKIKRFNTGSLDLRSAYGKEILENIPESMKVGDLSPLHTFWVLPIEAQDPDRLIDNLRAKGYDATSKASSLVKLSRLSGQITFPDDLKLENLVYLPMAPTMKAVDKQRLLSIIDMHCKLNA